MARRRKKNKKKNVRAVGFPSPLAAILVSVGLLSLVHLWLCGRCEALGKEITTLEKRKIEAHRRALNEQYKWSNMKSPQNMERLLKRHHLEMRLPNESFVVRVRTSVLDLATGTTKPSHQQFARNVGAPMND